MNLTLFEKSKHLVSQELNSLFLGSGNLEAAIITENFIKYVINPLQVITYYQLCTKFFEVLIPLEIACIVPSHFNNTQIMALPFY